MKNADNYCKTIELPPIPEKRYFTIGEVSLLCELKPHVLRYWEQEFTALAPSKRRGNRRYYRLEDVTLVRKIRELLYEQGFTLQGAKAQLNQKKSQHQPVATSPVNSTNETISSMIKELEGLAEFLED
jgi:DNA-binding transcriptional MerR regulator